MSKKIKKGDNIIVITGKDKGKTGEVFMIDRKNLKAKVRGINIVKKHRKPSQDQPGGIEQIETFINISNIALIDPTDNKPSRVRFKFQDKKKIRVASRSGKEI
jgi:large subunit ribosomal protein L24